jgi:hypothetical protein
MCNGAVQYQGDGFLSSVWMFGEPVGAGTGEVVKHQEWVEFTLIENTNGSSDTGTNTLGLLSGSDDFSN